MQLKPSVILGLATLCAGVGLGIIVATSDPHAAEPVMIGLFWIALFLTVWGLVATLLAALVRRLPLALGSGFLWALAGTGLLMASRHGYQNAQLSGGVIFATLLVTVTLWIRSRKSNK